MDMNMHMKRNCVILFIPKLGSSRAVHCMQPGNALLSA